MCVGVGGIFVFMYAEKKQKERIEERERERLRGKCVLFIECFGVVVEVTECADWCCAMSRHVAGMSSPEVFGSVC